MRSAIAEERQKSEGGGPDRWDLKYAPGGLIDLEFIAQHLQLVHAAAHPDILDTSTARVLDKAWRLGVLPAEQADVLVEGFGLARRILAAAPFAALDSHEISPGPGISSREDIEAQLKEIGAFETQCRKRLGSRA